MKIIVTDLKNQIHEIAFKKNDNLMRLLRENDMGIAAECDGCCVCATCHIYVDLEWFPKLEAMDENEQDMLDEACNPKENSRLACQVTLSDFHDGMSLIIGPEWA